ncbi:MAG: hypothetical protein A3K67_04365 [Euryarchaeota archaeon RBG_16_62_10]|nr:MAG: hypothetical protein A3K67_04365 [Euryarchaeota archaeon RBG_16_62_10]
MTVQSVHSTDAPKPIGPYSQAVVAGETVYSSGQIGLDPETGELVAGGAAAQAHRALTNLEAVLRTAGSGLDKVVKVTLFLRSMGDFAEVNRAYAEHFRDHRPARSAVEVSRLPKDALVEIETVATVNDA